MYWPIGPAKAYEQRLPTHSLLRSTDGADTQATCVEEHEETNGEVGESNGNDHGSAPSSPDARRRPVNGTRPRRKSQADLLDQDDGSILDLGVSKAGHIFATITRTTLTVWQTRPAVIITSLVRTTKSLKSYGHNVRLLLRPDADIIVIQSANGYLITYSLLLELGPRVYQLHLVDGARNARRRNSIHNTSSKHGTRSKNILLEGGGDVQEARLHFRMVIRLDAGISKALALDNELIVVTKEPGAVQCIRWSPDRAGAQFSTEMLSNMPWLKGQNALTDVIYDKPMNLFAFVSQGGQAYAVQRLSAGSRFGKNSDALFDGHIFHEPREDKDVAVKAAINSRFSLIALGCEDGSICLYSVQNYAGGIRLLKRLPLPAFALFAGKITSLCYSPDGYCLFVGYENGWLTWSVYGQVGGSSFGCDVAQCQQNGDDWLSGITSSCWVGAGSDVLMLTPKSHLVWSQEFARSAVTGCYNPANVSKTLLQTSAGLIVYQGDQLTDLATITSDASVWQHVQAPVHYMADQWPLRAAVISPDRRYIAIAGQRGLAHYSLASGRWRTFQNAEEQNDFTVRGGMCWHHHVLIAAVETSYGTHELRLYSRELPLENGRVLHSVGLSSPVVNISTTGDDGVLVYMYDNTLDHYVVDSNDKAVQLIKVGQITLTGVIRAPPRVRAVSWIVPDLQLQQGEASQDVTSAAVLFLIDGKLVLLQPSLDDNGELKYDMRVIASNIEYFALARDDPAVHTAIVQGDYDGSDKLSENMLKDSLWAFDGYHVKVWPDIQELLGQDGHELDTSIDIGVDFYTFSAPLQKGLLVGAEAELTQRRDVNFSYFRTVSRTTLFLPAILRYYLTHYDVSSALRLSAPFQHLPYFSHALEILLHTVLDEEVERPATSPTTPMHSRSNTATATATNGPTDYLTAGPTPTPSFLPTILDFLSNFPNNLDIILQCTRKTELRSWRTLFAHLPPPAHLFEQALQAGDLKTAGGYLLVLQQHQTDAEEAEAEQPANDINGTNVHSFFPTPLSPDPTRPTSASQNSPSTQPQAHPFSLSTTSDHDAAIRSAQVVPQAIRLLRRAQEAQEWDLCKELARFLMALDESGETLRAALEAVRLGEIDEEEGERKEVDKVLKNGNGVDGLGVRGQVDCAD